MALPGTWTGTVSRLQGVSPFCCALPAKEKISPSFWTTAPWPSGLASTWAQGRGVVPVMDQLLAVGREAVGQGEVVRRPQAAVEHACAGEGRGQLGEVGRWPERGGSRWPQPPACSSRGVAVDQPKLGAAARRQRDAQLQAGDRVEAVEQALVGHVAHPPGRKDLGSGQRSDADEAGARVLVAGERDRGAGAGMRRVEGDLARERIAAAGADLGGLTCRLRAMMAPRLRTKQVPTCSAL